MICFSWNYNLEGRPQCSMNCRRCSAVDLLATPNVLRAVLSLLYYPFTASSLLHNVTLSTFVKSWSWLMHPFSPSVIGSSTNSLPITTENFLGFWIWAQSQAHVPPWPYPYLVNIYIFGLHRKDYLIYFTYAYVRICIFHCILIEIGTAITTTNLTNENDFKYYFQYYNTKSDNKKIKSQHIIGERCTDVDWI